MTTGAEPGRRSGTSPALLALATVSGILVLVVAGAALILSSAARAGGPGATAEIGRLADRDDYAVWERNDDGRPVRWDPCSPIEVVLSSEGAPTSAGADLAVAIERIEAVTDLRLELVDATDERPRADRPAYQPERYGQRWAPVLVAWAPPHTGDLPLRDIDRGLAIPVAAGPSGDRVYLTGQIVLNADRDDLVAGFGDREDAWGATLLHELLHLLGLDHVEDETELMSTYPGRGPVTFGDGDLAGLAAVGTDHGCISTPDPGPLEMVEPTDEAEPHGSP